MATPLGGGARGSQEGGVTGGTPAPEDQSATRQRMTTSDGVSGMAFWGFSHKVL